MGQSRPAAEAPRPAAAVIQELVSQLASKDARVRAEAIEALRHRVLSPHRGMIELRTIWFRPLMAGRYYQEVLDLTEYGLLTYPNDTKGVEALLSLRIRARLAAGQRAEALADAKRLFNVASMEGTADAMLLVAECLMAAYPDDPEIYQRYRQEQLAGASTRPTTRASDRPRPILAAVACEPEPYLSALQGFPGEDFASLLARGNLLLMADRPGSARAVFERLYSIAKPTELAEASECIARTMKAEDGTIGRANAWVLSIRPKSEATHGATTGRSAP